MNRVWVKERAIGCSEVQVSVPNKTSLRLFRFVCLIRDRRWLAGRMFDIDKCLYKLSIRSMYTSISKWEAKNTATVSEMEFEDFGLSQTSINEDFD